MIFRNLLDNAIKYAGDPPEASVTLSMAAPDRAQIRVQDNGQGIPKAHRGRIFARFVRLGSELERKRPGTGLGLFIVRTLVKRLKGSIEIIDSGAGVAGTLFEVQLPGAKLESASVSPTSASQTSTSTEATFP